MIHAHEHNLAAEEGRCAIADLLEGKIEYVVAAAWLAAGTALSFVVFENSDLLAGLAMAAPA